MTIELKDEVKNKIRQWKKSPLTFVKECIDVNPSKQQIEGLQSLTKTKRLTIRSGHGTGKDAFAAWAILWFMSTRPYAKVACTAPTARQLNDVLWSEIAKWFRKSKLQDEFIHQKDKFFHKAAPKEWWCRAISPQVRGSKEDQAETLAGLHGDHLLIVVDEASGVPDPVFTPLEGAMTQEDNKTILIGNMTKNVGYFYDTHYESKLSGRWKKLHWDSRESENVSSEMVDYFRIKYGEDSNVFRIRVMGEPPLSNDNSVIPLHWARQCLGRNIIPAEDEPLYLGADIARFGDDATVILPRVGNIIKPWETIKSMNVIDVACRIQHVYRDIEAEGVAIDEIGIGAGVFDWLNKHNMSNVYGINVATRSDEPDKYSRLRDQLWWAMRENCEHGRYSFPDTEEGEELCNELASPLYRYNETNGAVKVESKREMKMRGVASPNIADALGLTEYFASYAHTLFKNTDKKTKAKYDRGRPDQSKSNSTNWQTV